MDKAAVIKSNPNSFRLYSQRLKLTRENGGYVALCPFREENTPSFKLFQKDGVWLHKCFGCGKSGNCLQFIQEFDSISFPAAVHKAEEFLAGTFDNTKSAEQVFKPLGEAKIYKTYPLSKWTEVFEKNFAESTDAFAWMAARGISASTAIKLHIGYTQSVKGLAGKDNPLDAKGWIAFPSIRGEEVVCIKYRSIAAKKLVVGDKKFEGFCRQPGMETCLFNENTIDELDTLYVVEGEMDALTLEQAGFHTVSIPSASTKISVDMKLRMLDANQIILAGDSDFAGSEAMNKLWAEMQERTFLLKWPDDLKDANEVFLKKSKGDIARFQQLVNELTVAAKSQPIPNVYSLQESMLSANRTNLSDHPKRLRFPWPSVDKMAILLPGSVMALSATQTKQGKSVFALNFTLDDAIKHDEVVLNYQCELSTDEISNIVTAHVLKKDRNTLTKEDYVRAAKFLGNIKYYIGRDPTLTTVTPVLDLIENAIRRLGATIVVLDHLHFICRNENNEIQAQANAMQRIKNMAGKYGVKFIVVGQPRKSKQETKGKMIHITDMKGSESIISDSDAFLVIHRDVIKNKDPNNPPMDDYEPKTEVHLLAARAKGPGATMAVLAYYGALASFHELSSMEAPQ